ncbi:unnamed protein product [Caenorhabditis sp. 36 PRJEB53466]|nr:unnamed protein product [Caenorhabditis sp. 36 PRJEB53466]
MPRQQTVLVPVYSYGASGYGAQAYPGYGMGYPGYGMYQGAGYPMMMGSGGGACCGGAGDAMMMPPRESNAKKFLRGATEGVFMGSVGMLGFRK